MSHLTLPDSSQETEKRKGSALLIFLYFALDKFGCIIGQFVTDATAGFLAIIATAGF